MTGFLEQLSIASPCKAAWDDMKGDERTRSCDLCQKKVYNVAGMARAEAEALIAASSGPICMRLFRRSDGTVLTSDCPVGLAARARRQARLAAAAVFTFLGLGIGASIAAKGDPNTSVVRKLFSRLFPAPPAPPPVMMGEVDCPPRRAPAPASSPAPTPARQGS